MVGVRVLSPQLNHGRLHGRGLRLSLLQARVEGNHEVFSTLVVHVPQAENERLRSCLEQAASQADQLIAGRDHIQSRGAPAENYQLGR